MKAQDIPLNPASDADRCVAFLEQSLRRGDLAPSQRLGEESVAQKLKMGRAPVRIAFERMVSAGLFERLHRSGTFVRRLDLKEYRDLTEVRALLEGHAAALVAQRASRAELGELQKQASELEARLARLRDKSAKSWGEIRSAEAEFHMQVAQLARNEVLCRTLTAQNLIRCCFAGKQWFETVGESAQIPPDHIAVAEAMASREPAQAEAVMRRHILLSLQNHLRAVLGDDSPAVD